MQALDFRLQGTQEKHGREKTVNRVKTNQVISHDVEAMANSFPRQRKVPSALLYCNVRGAIGTSFSIVVYMVCFYR